MLRRFIEKIKIILEMIKYQHSLHTLPFVYLGAFLSQKTFPGWEKLGWITLGMMGARSLALALNRYIDREIDARNPRTADRAMAKGLLSAKECLAFCFISLTVCLLSAYHLPSLVWFLSPIILFMFIFYPHTKRFTWTCHFWLGLTMGLAPLGGWIAVSNRIEPAAILLLLAVFSLIAGSDIIYTCQDIEVDRSQGLKSIPSVLGIESALVITRILHLACFVSLFAVGILLELNIVYFTGITLCTIFVAYQNTIISAATITRANEAFLATNVFVSLVVFLFTISSIWLKMDGQALPKLTGFF